jgi:hypothetical protein
MKTFITVFFVFALVATSNYVSYHAGALSKATEFAATSADAIEKLRDFNKVQKQSLEAFKNTALDAVREAYERGYNDALAACEHGSDAS